MNLTLLICNLVIQRKCYTIYTVTGAQHLPFHVQVYPNISILLLYIHNVLGAGDWIFRGKRVLPPTHIFFFTKNKDQIIFLHGRSVFLFFFTKKCMIRLFNSFFFLYFKVMKKRRDLIQCTRRVSGITFIRYAQGQNIWKRDNLK